jgi:hypothetical protein
MGPMLRRKFESLADILRKHDAKPQDSVNIK